MNQRTSVSFWLSLVLASAAPMALLGCQQGSEGDRCNPDLVNTTECGSGLRCVTPSSCVISVCCPSEGPYNDPQCQCFVHPEGCACNVDASFDSGAPPADAGTSSGKDASHD